MIGNLTLEAVEKAIGEPARTWPKRCFEIASHLVESGILEDDTATAVYGHWTGPVSRRSPFAGRASHGFVQHGWVSIPDEGIVIDPTRWVFEGRRPYIYVGTEPDPWERDTMPCTCGHIYDEHERGFFRPCTCCNCADFQPEEPDWPYDEGGNRFRAAMRKPPPPFNLDRKCFRVDFGKAARWVSMLIQGKNGKLSDDQLFWLANLPFDHFGGMAHEVYEGIASTGLAGYVPYDNRERAKREA